MCAVHNNNTGTQSPRDTLERQFHNIPGADEKLMSFDTRSSVSYNLHDTRISNCRYENFAGNKCRVHRASRNFIFSMEALTVN